MRPRVLRLSPNAIGRVVNADKPLIDRTHADGVAAKCLTSSRARYRLEDSFPLSLITLTFDFPK